MKIIATIICLTVLSLNHLNAQEDGRLQVKKLMQSEERAHLDTIVQLKVDYDKAIYLTITRNRDDQPVEERFETYVAYIHQIKKESTKSKILKYIDQALALDSNYMQNTYQYYSYIDMSPLMDRSKIISNYDYYRIIKHYLFKLDADQLPELDDIPFVNKQTWQIPQARDIKQE